MKKTIAALLSLAFLFSLTACSAKQQPETQVSEATSQAASDSASDATEAAVTAEDATIAAAEVPAVQGYAYAGERSEEPQPVRNHITYTKDDDVYEYVFGFAPDGSSLSVTSTDPDGGPYYSTIYFNADGKVERVENGSGFRTECTYAADKSTSSTYDAEGAQTEYLEYTYTADEKVESIKSYDTDGQLVQWTSFQYDANGYLVQKILTDENTEYVYEITNDENGKPLQNIVRADGEFYGATSYTYDERGNKATFLLYSDESLATASDTSSYSYTYNPDGTLALLTCSIDNAVDHTIAYAYESTVYPQYIDFILANYAFD